MVVIRNFNSHIGEEAAWCEGIHGSFSVGSNNREGCLVPSLIWRGQHMFQESTKGNLPFTQIDFVLLDQAACSESKMWRHSLVVGFSTIWQWVKHGGGKIYMWSVCVCDWEEALAAEIRREWIIYIFLFWR